ncbi:MAG: choice-of-anchor tandem repeat GloVer-containing protein [Pseudomonadota bacterium]
MDLFFNSCGFYSRTTCQFLTPVSLDLGIVFSINTDGSEFTPLHEFAGGTGDGSTCLYSSLTGPCLYGMTSLGGASNLGVIFKLSDSVLFENNGGSILTEPSMFENESSEASQNVPIEISSYGCGFVAASDNKEVIAPLLIAMMFLAFFFILNFKKR